MSKTAYEAAIQRLRGEALTAMSVIDGLLSSHSPDPNAAELIMEQAEKLATKEASMITLQQYFGQRYAPPAPVPAPQQPAAAAAVNDDPPIKVTPEMSPSYKREVEKQKIRSSVRSAPKKKKSTKKNEDS